MSKAEMFPSRSITQELRLKVLETELSRTIRARQIAAGEHSLESITYKRLKDRCGHLEQMIEDLKQALRPTRIFKR